MSAIGDALTALKAALKLTDDVKVLSETVKAFSREIQDLDRRTTRVEARLDTIMEFATSARRVPSSAVRRLKKED